MTRFLSLAVILSFFFASPVYAENKDGAKAVMNVFSGRPNPSWTLSKEQTLEMLRRSYKLTKLQGSKSLKENALGYNGVVVTASVKGDRYVFDVRHGIVKATTPDGFTLLSDADRLFEAWLVKTSQGKIPGDVFKAAVYDVIKDRHR